MELSAEYALQAMQNPASRKVVLGKFDGEGISYIDVVEDLEATYFQLENWDEVASTFGKNNDMWLINEQFLNQQWKAGKEFFCSHNPLEATGYFAQEIEFLESKGVNSCEKIGENLWKAIK